MKICAISDFHGLHMGDIKVPSCDVLCIAGDFVYLETQRDLDKSDKWLIEVFIPWINKLDCNKVIVTPGNHDFIIEDYYRNDWKSFKDKMYELSNEKLIFLIDEQYTYNDKVFYGCPYVKTISFGNWAFQKDGYYNIPDNIDILITHDSPFYNSNVISNAKYHFFGHWHDGATDSKNSRYNCAILNDYYTVKWGNKRIIVDIPDIEKTTVPSDIEYSASDDTCNIIKIAEPANLHDDKQQDDD